MNADELRLVSRALELVTETHNRLNMVADPPFGFVERAEMGAPELANAVDMLQLVIAEQPAMGGWIAAGEELPRPSPTELRLISVGQRYVGVARWNCNRWWSIENRTIEGVTHWMSFEALPAPTLSLIAFTGDTTL
jgi:hypothetical protein